MPTYLYKREDGSTFEIEQRITAPALKECPTTGQVVERLISPGAGLIIKGSGFYITDYARKGNGSNDSSSPDSTQDQPGGDKQKSSTDSSSSSSSSSSDSPASNSSSSESSSSESKSEKGKAGDSKKG